jgi:hypothetical protein
MDNVQNCDSYVPKNECVLIIEIMNKHVPISDIPSGQEACMQSWFNCDVCFSCIVLLQNWEGE